MMATQNTFGTIVTFSLSVLPAFVAALFNISDCVFNYLEGGSTFVLLYKLSTDYFVAKCHFFIVVP